MWTYKESLEGSDGGLRKSDMSKCYTLSRSRDSPSSVTVLWAVGLQRVHSSILSVIMIIPFTHPSPNSVSPYVSCFRFLLCFMFPFLFAFSVLSYFRPLSLNPDPDICPIHITLLCSFWYLYVPILMYAPQSEIDIDCPSNSPSNLRTLACLSSEIRGQ